MMAFDSHMPVQKIVVVGLGGTGSQIARSLARMLYDMRSRNLQTPRLTFIDPDVVEVKNVGRQMFTLADVGQHKAELLARRFNYALGLDIRYVNEPYSDEANFGTLVVGAVDNHEARKAIADAKPKLWIDCGNHFDTGQVVIGTTDDPVSITRYWYGDTLRELPNAALLFPDLLLPDDDAKPATVADLSCADLVEQGDQHLLVNEYVALVAASYVYKLLHRQPVTSFMTYVDAGGLMRPVPITRDNLAVYLPSLKESA
jgi:PRTRC genetic system ThiF family protein